MRNGFRSIFFSFFSFIFRNCRAVNNSWELIPDKRWANKHDRVIRFYWSIRVLYFGWMARWRPAFPSSCFYANSAGSKENKVIILFFPHFDYYFLLFCLVRFAKIREYNPINYEGKKRSSILFGQKEKEETKRTDQCSTISTHFVGTV